LAKKYKQQIFTRNKANKPYSIGELLRFLQQSDQVTARVKSSYHNMITSIARMNGILYAVEDEVFLEMIAIEAVQSIVGSYPHKAPLVLRDAMELGSRDVLRREYAHSCRYHERQEHNQGKGYKPRILIHLI
jgi:hypothetical protein